MSTKSMYRSLLQIKNLNFSKIGEVALNNSLKDCSFKDLLQFENVEEKHGRTLTFKQNAERRKDYSGHMISVFTNTSPVYSEILFFKDYYTIIDSRDYRIINDAIRFFSKEFIDKFYNEFKIELLNKLELDPISYSVEISKAIPNNYYYDVKDIGIKFSSECVCDGILSKDIEFLSSSNSVMVPFISFIDDYGIGKRYLEDEDYIEGYGCLTIFPTSNNFYRVYKKINELIEIRNDGDLKSLRVRKRNLLSACTLRHVEVVIGNLFNYLLVKVVDNNTKETRFIYFDKFGGSPKLLKNHLSIPYIQSLLKKDTSIVDKTDFEIAKKKYYNKKSELESYLDRYIFGIVNEICAKCDSLFKLERPDLLFHLNKFIFICGDVTMSSYLIKEDCVELHDLNKQHYSIQVEFVHKQPKKGKCIHLIDMNIDDLASDNDELENVKIGGTEYLNEAESMKKLIDTYILKPFKSNGKYFKGIYYKDDKVLEMIVNELKELNTKLNTVRKQYNNDKNKVFNSIHFSGKDIDIQSKFTEIEYYAGSSDYRMNLVPMKGC